MAYTTINKSTDYFRIKTFTGNGTNDTAITWDESSNMQPDFLWFKNRSEAQSHALFDVVRGANKRLISNSNGAEGTEATNLDSFDTNGFTVDNELIVNGSGDNMVTWGWKAGTTSGITTDSYTTITPTAYSFNATSGFSIIKYNGNATANAKFPHGLGVAPKFVIIKQLDATNYWYVHHNSIGSNTELYLNTTDAAPATTSNDITPDSTNIKLSGTGLATNGSGNPYIAYCFAEKTGYSKFGSYKGNGNADGTFIYTGFKPAWLVTKRTDGADNWSMWDSKRDAFNEGGNVMEPDTNSNEWNDANFKIDFVSNGIKLRMSHTQTNEDGGDFIYMAFAEAPLVGSNNTPCTAR